MQSIRTITLVFTFLLGAILFSACIVVDSEPDNAIITCDSFDDYLYQCYPTCAATWDCVYYYDTLDRSTQSLLDDCADCLYSNRFSCSDCVVGSESCYYLLEYYLGVECVW
jgi:hypothetical protein